MPSGRLLYDVPAGKLTSGPDIIIVLGVSDSDEATPVAQYFNDAGRTVRVIPLPHADELNPNRWRNLTAENYAAHLAREIIDFRARSISPKARIVVHSTGALRTVHVVSKRMVPNLNRDLEGIDMLAPYLSSQKSMHQRLIRNRQKPLARGLFRAYTFCKRRFEREPTPQPVNGYVPSPDISVYHSPFPWLPGEFHWQTFRALSETLDLLPQLECPVQVFLGQYDHRVPHLGPDVLGSIPCSPRPLVAQNSGHLLLLDNDKYRIAAKILDPSSSW